MTEPPLLLGVVGDPILHSRSPELHEAGLAALGLSGRYLRLAAFRAADALRVAREMGLRGFNVTAPFKEEMAGLVDALDPRAQALGAVNTVLLEPSGRTTGFNTDGDGVLGALKAAGCPVQGQAALVLGAGGAAKAAVLALLAEGARVTVANRTLAKAEALARELECAATDLTGAARVLSEASILVGCASTAERLVDPAFLHPSLTVLEGNYRQETALRTDARARGCRVVPGQAWLLHQGLRAFQLFTGRPAPAEAMAAALNVATDLGGGGRPRSSILLAGFMGSGKSAVARALGARLGAPIVDLDEAIVAAAGMSIPEIFRSRGEGGFRELEATVLGKVLETPCVLALGGGAVLRRENRQRMKLAGLGVWLWASLPTLLARAGREGGRPLLDEKDPGAAARLLRERMPFYAEVADLVLDADTEGIEALAARLAREMGAP